jgi:hypothetical protein
VSSCKRCFSSFLFVFDFVFSLFCCSCFVYSFFLFASPASRSSYVLFCGIFCPSFVHPLFLLVAIFALVFFILLPVFQLCSSLVATCGQRLHIFVASFVQFCVLVSHLLSSLCASSHCFVSSFLCAESRALENLVSSW